MTHEEWLINLREANKIISKIRENYLATKKNQSRKLMPYDPKLDFINDVEREILREHYEEFSRRPAKFDPELEYGKVETLTEEQKRGYHD